MPKAKRKSYDDKFRASAVVMLQAAGYPDRRGALEHTAKHIHVPARTLSRWFNGENNPPPDEVVSKKESDLLALLTEELAAVFQAMPSARKDATYRDLGTVGGILMDKLLLLQGKPTQRAETSGKIEHAIGDTSIDRFAEIFDILQGVGALPTGTPETAINGAHEPLHSKNTHP